MSEPLAFPFPYSELAGVLGLKMSHMLALLRGGCARKDRRLGSL